MRTSSKMLCCWYVCTLLDYRSIYAASKIITTDPSHIKLSHWTSLLRSRCSVPMTSSLLAGCFFSHLETCLKELTTSVPHSWLDEWVWNREHKPLQSFKEAHKLILQPAVIRQVNALYLFRVYRPSIASIDFFFKRERRHFKDKKYSTPVCASSRNGDDALFRLRFCRFCCFRMYQLFLLSCNLLHRKPWIYYAHQRWIKEYIN